MVTRRWIPALTAALVAIGLLAVPQAARRVDAGRATGRTGAAATGPARIISLVPAATEMLFALDAGPRVVAVSSYDHFPPAVNQLPRVGALLDPDLERIFSFHPDLVVVYGTQAELIQQLGHAGIGVFPFVHGGLSDVFATMRHLGDRIAERPAADALVARLTGKLKAIRARVAGDPRPRTMLVFERTPFALGDILASGGVGFLNDMLVAAGGNNVFADIHRESVPVSTEMVLARRPDVILELHYGETIPPADLARDRATWDRLASVPAVRNHRVYLLVGNDLVSAGPRVAEATGRLARALHPDAFGEGKELKNLRIEGLKK